MRLTTLLRRLLGVTQMYVRQVEMAADCGSPQTSVGRGAAVSGSARIVAAQPWGSAGRAFT